MQCFQFLYIFFVFFKHKYIDTISKNAPCHIQLCTLDVVRISSCHWIFDHKWFSEADTSKEHIEHIIFFLYPLANPLTTDLFWCRLYQLGQLAEKQCPWVDRLEGEENFFCGQCVPNGCLLWKMTYGKISDHMKNFFMTSNVLYTDTLK